MLFIFVSSVVMVVGGSLMCADLHSSKCSFDDGPSDYTADLVNYMDEQQIKSTFFIVGSRAISRPQVLQAEYMAGHQLSVHTWSHPPLTTLTNEQIIAELGWTREAIRQITGVSPNTMRPPVRIKFINWSREGGN